MKISFAVGGGLRIEGLLKARRWGRFAHQHSRADSTPGGIETHVARGCRCHTQKARTEGLNSNVPAGVFSINAMVMLRLGVICPVAQCGVR